MVEMTIKIRMGNLIYQDFNLSRYQMIALDNSKSNNQYSKASEINSQKELKQQLVTIPWENIHNQKYSKNKL